MATGIGFDAIYLSSATLSSSPQRPLGCSRRFMASCAQSLTFHSSPWCVLSPSLLQLSLPGCRASGGARARNCSWSRARIGNATFVKKCGHQQNSLLGEVDCMLHSREGAKKFMPRDAEKISRRRTSRKVCGDLSGCFVHNDCVVYGSLSEGNVHSRHLRRRPLTILRCEAEGGGTSYNDRIATAETGPDTTGGTDRYAGDGGKAGAENPANESESSIASITNGSSGEDGSLDSSSSSSLIGANGEKGHETGEESAIEVLKEILRVAQEDLEKCRRNSEMLEVKAQEIAEKAIALKDEAADAENLTNAAILKVEEVLCREARVEEELQTVIAAKAEAEHLLRLAKAAWEEAVNKVKTNDVIGDPREVEKQDVVEAKVEVVTERTLDVSVESVPGEFAPDTEIVSETETVVAKTTLNVEGSNAGAVGAIAAALMEETEALESATTLFRDNEASFGRIEADLFNLRAEKAEYQREIERLSEFAAMAKETALAADEDVASAMAEAEQAVALELEAAQRVGDAEFALQKAESYAADAAQAESFAAIEAEKLAQSVGKTVEEIEEELEQRSSEAETERASEEVIEDGRVHVYESGLIREDTGLEKEADIKPVAASTEVATSAEKAAKENDSDSKKSELEKKSDPVKELLVPKASKKRSSRFFSASYFSSEDGEEFSPGKAYADFAMSLKPQLAKIVIGVALLFVGGSYVKNRLDKPFLLPQSPAYTTSIEQVNASTKPIVVEFKKLTKHMKDIVHKIRAQEVNEEEASLFDVLWLLLASVVFVPLFMKIPGGSPVLGYLVAGVLIGPHTMHIVQNVHGTKAIAEFGVVFLLFNIGLELSVERLSSMKKYVFGLGTTQVLATAAAVGLFLNFVSGISGPAAIIIASGLALSSTAVVLQVLQERGESTSRHGRATFSVLLFQDLAVVVLLILIPLLSAKGGVGLQEIGAALGIAGIKALVAIVGIIASGRLFLRPIYKQMADNHNAEIFAANTLLVVLGTSVLTARAGLSMALGAFLAGLLLAETEFALQVESDIAPYRGLLLGLFFMTVGMSIDPKIFVARFTEITAALALLIVGKTVLVASVGRLFGLSAIAAVRAGLLLAPGGEFAFVAFGEAVNQGILSSQLSSLLFLVVGLSMALTPWLAAGGQLIAARFEQQDVRSLLPQENETDDLQGHIIICGFGRVGQIIAQLLAERLIPFVALDVRSERVSMGRQLDLPVYFGDAGSKEVLHKIGAERAAAAVITLDTPGANYRTVWALSKHFPGVKTFVRAHDVDHGINLEKAGATAVVPETLEPSLQLAAAVLAQAKVPAYEIASAIDEFRSRHLSELTELSETSGTSLGYGFSRVMTKPLSESLKVKPDEEGGIEKRMEGSIIAVP